MLYHLTIYNIKSSTNVDKLIKHKVMGKQNYFCETVFKFKAISHFHGITIHNLYSRLKFITYFNIILIYPLKKSSSEGL